MKRHASMNRIYRLVWSRVWNAWVAVAETVRGRGKGSNRKLIAAALALSAVIAQAAPVGGQVAIGTGSISQAGSTTTIQQSSQNLSLNWQSFNIAPQETVNFRQPSAAAIAVNRIFDTNGTQILGHLNANGQVWLVNPNGILFGQGAQVNVGALVASTLNLNDASLNGNARTFSGNGSGSVVNQGTINAADGGYVALLGNHVSNQGTISARLGSVALGAGSAATLTFSGNSLVKMQVDQSVLASLAENGGLINADGGMVVMNAGAKNALLASVVNNTGVIEARTVENHAGVITLLGGMTAGQVNVGGTLDASAAGVVSVSGTLDASGKGAGQTGGSVSVLGQHVGLFGQAKIVASGDAGGGTVLVGGDYQGKNPSVQNASATYVSPDASVNADAITSGNGGKVIVWSNDVTRAYGSFSARGGAQSGDGGLIETSGHFLDVAGVGIDAGATHGRAGTWLLDPFNVTITSAAVASGAWRVPASPPATTIWDTTASGSNVTNTTISGYLNSGTNVSITTTPFPTDLGTEPGNITVNAPILHDSNSAGSPNVTLTLTAGTTGIGKGNIVINDSISASTGSNVLNVVLNSAGGSVGFGATGSLSTNGGNVTIIAGTTATLGNISTGAGTISATSTGNTSVFGAIQNTNTGTSAIVLKAGDGTAAGTATGGDISITTGSITTPGQALLYTGSVAGSAGVGALVGGGNSRYNSTPLASGYNVVTAPLGTTGTFAIYREQPLLVITANNPTAITYGDAKPAYTTAVTNLQNGDTAGQALSTAAPVADDGAVSTSNHLTATSHTLTPSGAIDQLGYALSYAAGTLTVSKLPLSAAIAGVGTTYGTPAATGAVTFGNVVALDVVTPATATIVSPANSSSSNLKAGTYQQAVSATLSGTDAGNYSFVGGFTTATNNYTVGQLALTGAAIAGNTSIYAAALVPGAVTFGNVVALDVVTDTASVNTSTLSSALKPVVGSYTQTAGVIGGTDAANYSFAGFTSAANYSITKLALTGAAIAGVGTTYGTPAATGAVTFGNVVALDVVTPATATIVSPANSSSSNLKAGTYQQAVSATLSGTDAGNYSFVGGFTTATNNYTVGQLALTVTATGTSKVYDGLLTDAVTLADNRVVGDVLTLSNSAANFLDKNVGTTKAVNVSGISVTNTDAGNYTFNTTAATTADITAAPLDIAANSTSKTYGSTVSFTGTEFSSAGLKNAETVGSVRLASVGAVATASVAGSPYNITASAATGGSFNAGNYTISYVDGTLTINSANLTPVENTPAQLQSSIISPQVSIRPAQISLSPNLTVIQSSSSDIFAGLPPTSSGSDDSSTDDEPHWHVSIAGGDASSSGSGNGTVVNTMMNIGGEMGPSLQIVDDGMKLPDEDEDEDEDKDKDKDKIDNSN
jgi:filamentous hemagglutinin family protein